MPRGSEPSPTAVTPAQPVTTHEDIAAREVAAARRRTRAWWLGGTAAVALLAGTVFGARPALHVVKAWQARRLAAQARTLMDEGKWSDARQRATDAFALWRNEPEAVRAVAQFLSRVGNFRQALGFWKQLDAIGALTPADARDLSVASLETGDPAAAERYLRRAWPADRPGTPADWSLGLSLAMRRNQPAEAAALARRLIGSKEASLRARLVAAASLATADPAPEAQALVWQTMRSIADEGRSAESLDALLTMARRAASLPEHDPLRDTLPPLPDLLSRIDAHPLAGTRHHLLVVEIRMAPLDAAGRADLLHATVERYGGSREDADLAGLTAWLYGKGEFEELLRLLPPDRAKGDRALFLQRMDALAAVGRWKDIREAIQGRQFPLEPMIAQMYLGRCAAQLGEDKARDAAWETALAAAGADPAKLLAVGQYTAKNGALGLAERAARTALVAQPDAREAHELLFQVLQASGQTRSLREALIAYAALYPNERAVRNDIAYFDALLDVGVPAARRTAQGLVRADPASLPHHVTLALAELRLHNALAALDTLGGTTLLRSTALQPRQRAVYAAALWAASYEREAREMARSCALDQLLPEERDLVRPVLDGPAS